jgi:acyl-CoA synthetase (AMP-forming)/AMP-acid ligase II
MEEARRRCGLLRGFGAGPGDRAIVLLATAFDFVTSFWGCVLAGVVPVPLAGDVPVGNARRFRAIFDLLEEPWVIAPRDLVETAREALPDPAVAAARVRDLDGGGGHGRPATGAAVDPEKAALILLTSGSTGTPKGVPLSHRNILSRTAASRGAGRFGVGDVSVNWFPLDHVGGLVMFHVHDLCVGCRQIHVDPAFVLADPLRWLDLLSEHCATATWAPNFAFGMVNAALRDSPQGRDWRLDRLRFVLNAGEAINPRTAAEFMTRLAPFGLRQTAMVPGWGMSETSSAVVLSFDFNPKRPATREIFTDLGRPIAGTELRIVDDAGPVICEERAGNLEVRGDAVCGPYLGASEITREAFTKDGWLKTGDVGFLVDGRLVLTGRKKDTVIVNGMNFSCHELEAAASLVSGVLQGSVAACPIRDERSDTDSFVVLFTPALETPGLTTLVEEVRRSIVAETSLSPYEVVAIPAEAIPRTNIGKVKRAELVELYRTGELPVLQRERGGAGGGAAQGPAGYARHAATGAVVPAEGLAGELSRIWSSILGVAFVDPEANLFRLGADSIMVQRFIAMANARGILLSARAVFERQTVRELAACARPVATRAAGAGDTATDTIAAMPDELDVLRATLDPDGSDR